MMDPSRMWQGLLPFIILHILLIEPMESTYLCQNLQLQNCSSIECTPTTFSYECPRIQNVSSIAFMTIKVRINEEAKLDCLSPNVNYEWLKGINIGYVNFLDIRTCPLPKIPFYMILAHLNITGVKKIRIDSGLRNLKLDDHYFQKIHNVTHLLIPSNHLSKLPSKLFHNLTDLTNLDLYENNLTLANNELAGLVNLKKIELGGNNIQQLLPGTFQDLKRLEFLNLWGNKLTELTKQMFIGTENLMSLDVSLNQILHISADTFDDMKKLKFLSLLKNNFTSLPGNIFSNVKTLEIVKLHNNDRLSEIPNRLFADLPWLQEVYLSRCNLSSVPEDIFWGSARLVKVDLSRNTLATLPRLLFRDTENLKDLDISNNLIVSIPDIAFKPLKNLQILRLQKNKLTYIDEQLFQGLKDLQELYINNNNIENIHNYAFQNLKKLKYLVMSHNKITFKNSLAFDSSPLSHCTDLMVLDLSHNNISNMFSDWMWILGKLNSLNLSYNNFTRIDAHSLQFFSQHIDVNLQYNKIEILDLHWLETMNSVITEGQQTSALAVINLTGNELDCDCRLYELLRYRERKMQEAVYERLKLIVDAVTCKSPPALAGYPIAKLNLQTFTCEWMHFKRCPNGCQCSYWKYAKSLVVNCSGSGLTQVPEEILNPQFPDKLSMDLILDKNYLHSLSLKESLHKTNVTTLSLSHNYISWIDNDVLPITLKELKLDNNNLTHLNSSLLEFFTNRTNLTLHSNPWSCNCEALDFLGFLQNSYKQVANLNNVTCRDGSMLALLTADEICPVDQTITIIASSTIAVVGILIGLLAALYFRYQNEVKVWLYAHNMCLWFVTEDELDKDKIYDAFISYSHQDEDFVTAKLLPELENGNPSFKICIHYRDWIVGEFITTQITRSVDDSKRTIVVLSKNFIKSEWGRLEFRAAHKQALTEKRARVIVVVYGDLGPLDNLDSELRSYLSTNTYVKWGDPWFWDKLRYALPHCRKPAVKKTTRTDKLELINSSVMKSSTPPTDVAINPLEVINNFSSKKGKILNELKGYANNSYTNNSSEISVKPSECV